MAPRAGPYGPAGQARGSGNPAATNPMANPRVEATYARAMAAFQEGSFDVARRLIGENFAHGVTAREPCAAKPEQARDRESQALKSPLSHVPPSV